MIKKNDLEMMLQTFERMLETNESFMLNDLQTRVDTIRLLIEFSEFNKKKKTKDSKLLLARLETLIQQIKTKRNQLEG